MGLYSRGKKFKNPCTKQDRLFSAVSRSIYNVSILLPALWHAALAKYTLVWIEQVIHKDLVFRTWVFKNFLPRLKLSLAQLDGLHGIQRLSD